MTLYRAVGARGAGGAVAPPVFREICQFSPKKRGFQENFKISPPSFSNLKVSPPLFFGASYGPASNIANVSSTNYNNVSTVKNDI